MDQPGSSGLQGNPRVLSLNAQEKRSKTARLSDEVCAAGNAEAAQRMQVRRGQLTEEARVDANAQAAQRYSQTRIIATPRHPIKNCN